MYSHSWTSRMNLEVHEPLHVIQPSIYSRQLSSDALECPATDDKPRDAGANVPCFLFADMKAVLTVVYVGL